MYESSFGITGPPFQLTPDPSFYFGSRGHRRALAELREALDAETEFIVVSGEVGAGKTTVVRTLLTELDPALHAVAQIVSTQLDAEQLLSAMLIEFGLPANAGTPKELAARFQRFLRGLEKKARRAVLIIDEAQNLHREAFDHLVTLVSGKSPRRLPLQICLVGQPELGAMIASNELLALRQLVGASCFLGPLDRDETGAYIEHRLKKVGWSGTPSFEPGAFDEIFGWTLGIPRRINLLCNRLMLSRFLAQQTQIDVASVAKTAAELAAELGVPSPASTLAAPAVDMGPPVSDATRPLVVLSAIEPGPLLCVVGGRADHVKAAALMRALSARHDLPPAVLVRAYRNEAWSLSCALFGDLSSRRALIALVLAQDKRGGPSAELVQAFDFVVERLRPASVIVFDGSDAALSCARVACGRRVPVVHIGAGLRVGETSAASPSSRKLTDELAGLLYTYDRQASEVLLLEGAPAERVQCVGSLLVDAVRIALHELAGATRRRAESSAPELFAADRGDYAVVVLSQPVNLKDRHVLTELVAVLRDVSRDVPLVWPMAASVRAQIRKFRLDGLIAGDRIACVAMQPYPDYLAGLRAATCVLTDSWNVQEETTALGVPCLTLGIHPERAVTVSVGSNRVIGSSRTLATRAVWECLFTGGKRGSLPELWDGTTGSRIASHLAAWLSPKTQSSSAAR